MGKEMPRKVLRDLRFIPGGIAEGEPWGGWMDEDHGLPSLADGSVDLVLTSPPFNVSLKRHRKSGKKQYDSFSDDLELDIYQKWIGKRLFCEVYRVLAPDGNLVMELQPKYNKGSCELPELWVVPALVRAGFILRDRVIWHYEKSSDTRSDCFNRRHSVYFWASKAVPSKFYPDPIRQVSAYSKDKRCNDLGAIPPNVLRINLVHNTEWWRVESEHPALFPPEIVDIFVQGMTEEGDLVVDPFAGIGTVGAVCNWTNRAFIGFEISEKYSEFGKRKMLSSTRDDLDAWWPWLKKPKGRTSLMEWGD